jgi:hypothetical protein
MKNGSNEYAGLPLPDLVFLEHLTIALLERFPSYELKPQLTMVRNELKRRFPLEKRL